jgi:uracil-DNA glycosylase
MQRSGAMKRSDREQLNEAGWKQVLADEFAAPYMADLHHFLNAEEQAGAVVYPRRADIFRAFNLTPFADVRVVIVGQDPYHGPGQAHGLSFSVPAGVRVPPSLANIFREIQRDLGGELPCHGNLDGWATQGVLLLNATLTVRAGAAGSHRGAGWEQFTTAAIRAVNEYHDGVVFLLWGRHAQRAGRVIDHERHHVLTAAHPSPLSAHNGFFGCGHFSQTNKILREQGKSQIRWDK